MVEKSKKEPEREGVDSENSAARQIELGNSMLAAGNFPDALSHYHSAIELDPQNYVSYFRRATVYLALGKSKSALPDLTKVLELKPDVVSARSQRAKLYMKQGRLYDAESDFQAVIQSESENEQALSALREIPRLREQIEEARDAVENNNFEFAIELLNPATEACPWNSELHKLRAEAYQARGEYQKVVSDLRSIAKLNADDTATRLRLSRLLYDMGDAEQSLEEIRECLKLDQDHKECHDHYKQVKKLNKQFGQANDARNSGQYDECVERAEATLRTEGSVISLRYQSYQLLCHCYAKMANGESSAAQSDPHVVREALDACNKALEFNPEDVSALCDRGDAYIANEEFETAERDFQQASSIDQNNQRAAEGQKRAQKLLKQSLKRDYYKILGVKRNARKKEIMKAYRRLSKDYHPDKFPGEDQLEERKVAEKKFMDIAAAKEVLSDPELRRKFDNGEDPLDAEEQAGGGGFHGHPFFHGFNPFGQGGGGGGGGNSHFTFHFG